MEICPMTIPRWWLLKPPEIRISHAMNSMKLPHFIFFVLLVLYIKSPVQATPTLARKD